MLCLGVALVGLCSGVLCCSVLNSSGFLVCLGCGPCNTSCVSVGLWVGVCILVWSFCLLVSLSLSLVFFCSSSSVVVSRSAIVYHIKVL